MADRQTGMGYAALAGMSEQANRNVLGALLAFLALNAFAGGYYAMAGAEGVPVEWLAGSAFSTYFVPGLILFVIIGGSAMFAAFAVLARRPGAFDLAKLAGWSLAAWLATQLVIIGFVSWLQPTTAALAFVILDLAYRFERVPHAATKRAGAS